ncbi:MAG: carbohydrate ABC transporter permease [Pseudothermotoga sp.]
MLKKILKWIVISLVIFVFNLPLINIVMTSLKDESTISQSPPPLIYRPSLKNYISLFTSRTFVFTKFLFNSVVIALFTAAITLALCLPTSYAVIRFGIGKRLILPIVTNMRSVPLIIFAPSAYVLFKQTNVVDTRTGIILIHILVALPLALPLLISFMQDVPKEIQEAARIDGASDSLILLKIILPMILTSTVAVFLLSFVYSWNEFLFALILSIRKTTTLTVGASLFITAWGVQWGRIAAATTLSVIPPFVLSFYLQKYLVEAFTGGLKE